MCEAVEKAIKPSENRSVQSVACREGQRLWDMMVTTKLRRGKVKK